MLRETNPPLFYSLLKLWRMVVPSPGEWAIRLLPLTIGFAHLAVFGHYVRRRLGWPAALLGLLLFALSPADIYQSAYVRGYVLAKLMVLVSFIGLVRAIEADGDRKAARSGWAAYVLAAVVAIYCHTTMVLWPVIVTIAVLVDEGLSRRLRMGLALRLIGADLGIMVLSGWVIVIALAQLRALGQYRLARPAQLDRLSVQPQSPAPDRRCVQRLADGGADADRVDPSFPVADRSACGAHFPADSRAVQARRSGASDHFRLHHALVREFHRAACGGFPDRRRDRRRSCAAVPATGFGAVGAGRRGSGRAR
jgi:hypothetical protein